MFGEISKLLDRNFVIGYFLPSSAIVYGNFLLISILGLGPTVNDLLVENVLFGSTLLALIAWILGVILLVINRELIRTFEGYGRLNPLRFFHWMEKRRFKNIVQEKDQAGDLILKYKEIDSLEEDERNREENLSKARKKYARFMRILAEEFPEDEDLLLPTPFGNVIRAFEQYPKLLYGFDAIYGWDRLLAFIDNDFMEQIKLAKTQVDFWVNLGFLSFLFFLESATVASIQPNRSPFIIIPIISMFVCWIAASRATSAAIDWGDMVKSSFDIFLPDLGKKLGLRDEADYCERVEFWTIYSRAIIYRLPEEIEKLSELKS